MIIFDPLSAGKRQEALGISKAAQGFLGFAGLDSSALDSSLLPPLPSSSSEESVKVGSLPKQDGSKKETTRSENSRDFFKRKIPGKNVGRAISTESPPIISASQALPNLPSVEASSTISPSDESRHHPLLQSSPSSLRSNADSSSELRKRSDAVFMRTISSKGISLIPKKGSKVDRAAAAEVSKKSQNEFVSACLKNPDDFAVNCNRCGELRSDVGGSAAVFNVCVTCNSYYCIKCSSLSPSSVPCVSGSFHTLKKLDSSNAPTPPEKEEEILSMASVNEEIEEIAGENTQSAEDQKPINDSPRSNSARFSGNFRVLRLKKDQES